MFKSLKYKSDVFYKKNYTRLYVFKLDDTDFKSEVSIMVDATDGTEANSIAAAALIQEYKARNLSISKNLSLWYLENFADYKDRIFYIMEKDKRYIDIYFPALKYNKEIYQNTINDLNKHIKKMENINE